MGSTSVHGFVGSFSLFVSYDLSWSRWAQPLYMVLWDLSPFLFLMIFLDRDGLNLCTWFMGSFSLSRCDEVSRWFYILVLIYMISYTAHGHVVIPLSMPLMCRDLLICMLFGSMFMLGYFQNGVLLPFSCSFALPRCMPFSTSGVVFCRINSRVLTNLGTAYLWNMLPS